MTYLEVLVRYFIITLAYVCMSVCTVYMYAYITYVPIIICTLHWARFASSHTVGLKHNAALTRSAEMADVMMASGAVVNTPVSITRPGQTAEGCLRKISTCKATAYSMR